MLHWRSAYAGNGPASKQGQYLRIDDSKGTLVAAPGGGGVGSGDVFGPVTATDEAVARFDTTGKLLQNSTVTISDTGALSGVASINLNNGSLVTGPLSVFEGSFFKGNSAQAQELNLVNQALVGVNVMTGNEGTVRFSGSNYSNRQGQLVTLSNNSGHLSTFAFSNDGYLKVVNGVLTVEKIYLNEVFFDASVLQVGALTSWTSTQANYSLVTASGSVSVVTGGPNGLNVVDFGQDAGIYNPAPLWPWNTFTVHMVVNLSTVIGSSTFWSSGSYSTQNSLVAWSLNADNYVHDGAGGGHIPLGNNVAGQWVVMSWVKKTTSPHFVCYRNGVEIGSGDYFTNPVPTVEGLFGIGANFFGTNIGGEPLSVGEVRLYRKTQTGAEISTDVAALQTKWFPATLVTPHNLTANNSDPNFQVIASSERGPAEGWRAFNGLLVLPEMWESADGTFDINGNATFVNSFNPLLTGTNFINGPSLQITLNEPKQFNRYRIARLELQHTSTAPISWRLYGKNDNDTAFTLIDSVDGYVYQNNAAYEPERIIPLSNFRTIVLHAVKVQNNTWCAIAELDFYRV